VSQRIIGLTGGIGTGKSTVAECLRELGIPVADADQLARAAVAPGSAILQQIRDRFGSEILDATGQLDRRRLGERVFANPADRLWLEAQIHPFVKDQLVAALQEWVDLPVVCLMIPLLFEAEMTNLVTEIWVVTCPPDLQEQRLQQRDLLTVQAIHQRMASQWPLQQKTERANVVIDNAGSLHQLRDQILAALKG
jgi:dephospho-CoA kinase